MSKTLLIETHTLKSNPVQLTENVNSENGNLMVEGILATAEVKNGNGRYYSKELWNREMEKYKELIDDKSYLEGVLRSGAEAAQQRAYKVLVKVYRKAGFVERPR